MRLGDTAREQANDEVGVPVEDRVPLLQLGPDGREVLPVDCATTDAFGGVDTGQITARRTTKTVDGADLGEGGDGKLVFISTP